MLGPILIVLGILLLIWGIADYSSEVTDFAPLSFVQGLFFTLGEDFDPPITRHGNPVGFWIFVCMKVALAVILISLGCAER